MPAIFFALISFIGWGTADVFSTIATRRLGGFSVTLWTYILFLLIFSLYIPFALNDIKNMTLGLITVNIAIGITGLIGDIAYYEALRLESSHLVGTIASSFAAVTVILSVVFLKDGLTISQMMAIIIIFLGLILCTFKFKGISKFRLQITKGIFLAIITMLSWGVYYTFIKIPVKELGWFWPTYISLSLFPLIIFFLKLRGIKLNKPKSIGATLPLLALALLAGTGEFSYNFAINAGQTAIVAPIAGSYATLFVLLAFLVFKDPITRQQIAGIITTLIGIVLLSVFSV